MARADSRYRFVGTYAENLSDGSALEPGAFYDLPGNTFEGDPHNQDLLDKGVLIKVPEREKSEKAPTTEGGAK